MSAEIRITNRDGVWIIDVLESAQTPAPVFSPHGQSSSGQQASPLGSGPDNPPILGGMPSMPGSSRPMIIGPIYLKGGIGCPGMPGGQASPIGTGPDNPPILGGMPPTPGSSGPIILGPIIFDGGCSGQAVSTPALGKKAAAVSVNPPANPAEPHGIAQRQPFEMEWQELQEWCWAAVAVSVRKYLNGDVPNWTQPSLATPVLRAEHQISPAVDCDANPDLCDFGAALDDAALQTGNLAPQGTLVDQFLTFESIVKWVDQKMPIGARIAWFGGGAHFIAIDGYRDAGAAGKMVHIQDPFFGPALLSYDDLVSNYPPGGVWQDTYLFKVA
jgi:hypothetical protein